MVPINNALSILCMRDRRSIRHGFDDLKAPDRPNPGIGEPGHIRCVAASDSWRDRADQLVPNEPPIHRGGHPFRGTRHSIEELVSAALEPNSFGQHRLA